MPSSLNEGRPLSDLRTRIARLSPEDRTRLEHALLAARPAARDGHAIPRRPDPEACPLSPVQTRIWFLQQLDPASAAYNEADAVRLDGPLDVQALGASLDAVVARHEVLRTTVRAVDGRPVARVHDDRRGELVRIDLSDRPDAQRDRELARRLGKEARRPFDLAEGPLIRAVLCRLGERSHALMLVLHHLVCDSSSMGVLYWELSLGYRARSRGLPASLPSLPIQYGDVAAWQERGPDDAAVTADLAYWTAQLRDAPERLDLPLDRSRPAVMTYRGARHSVVFEAGLAGELRALARREAASLFGLLLATLTVLLYRYTGQDDLVIGVPVANRDRRELEVLIGPLMDTVALRADVSGEPSFRELLGRLGRAMVDGMAHRALPFERLVDVLQPERRLDHTPIFQVMATWRDPRALMRFMELPGLAVAPLEVDRGTSKLDLTVFFAEAGDEVLADVEFSTDLFEPSTIERMLGHLRMLVEGVVRTPGERVSRLPLLTPAERRRVLVEWNATAVDYPRHDGVHGLVAAHCRRTPGAVAVVHGSARLTYGELNEQATRVAWRLAQHGVARGDVVGVCCGRSPALVVGLLAVLKAGAAYLPLDPTNPPDRLALLIEDSGARLILADPALAGQLPRGPARVIPLPGEPPSAPPDATTLGDGVGGEDLAYVMYTSGSTGRPKGVEVPHRAIVRLLWDVDYVRLDADTRVLQLGSPAFDASTFEIWGPLLHRGCCVLYPDRVPGYRELAGVVAAHGVTTAFLTTALFNQLVDESPASLAGVAQLLFGGEPVSVPHVARALAALPGTELVHCYGPTEGTTFTTCHPVPRALDAAAPTIPIGRPIANTRVYVLDRSGQPVPVGVAGEIHIGGDGLARGYRNRPDLTAERFVPDPFADDAAGKLYRTGDRARYRPDGSIEYLGRLDDQIKIRGVRIEPAEVEAALRSHPGVNDAFVTAREHRPGETALVAYVTARAGARPELGGIRAHLGTRLPACLVPSHVVVMDRLPLTPNGKVDRGALPRPEPALATHDLVTEPRSATEELVAAIWAGVLGLSQVGPRDDFFELGGHSLLAIQAAARLQQAFGVDVPVRLVFERPTVAALAGGIEAALRGGGSGGELPPIIPAPRDRPLPLSTFQEEVWRAAREKSASLAYLVVKQFRLTGPLDVQALEHALTELVARHEVLRTTFATRSGEAVQVIGPAAPVTVRVLDLTKHAQPTAEADRLAREEAARPMDLGRGPLLRPTLLRLAPADSRLLLALHHAVFDGWTLALLFPELGALYRAFRRGEPPTLPPVRLQCGDVAVWQRRWLRPGEPFYERQIAYWRGELAGDPRPVELPRRPRSAAPSSVDDARVELALPPGWLDRVENLGRREGATRFMTLLAGFAAALHHATGLDDFVVGTYVSSRDRPEMERIAGFFVNLVPLRVRLGGDPPFRELLRRVRDATLGAHAHQMIPFAELTAALRATGGPVPDVRVIFLLTLDHPGKLLALDGLVVESIPAPLTYMPWGATVNVKDGPLLACWLDAAVYDPAAARALLERLLALLEDAAREPAARLSALLPEGVPAAPVSERPATPTSAATRQSP